MVQASNNAALVSRKPIPAFMTKQSAEIPKRPKFRVMSSVDELMSKLEVAGSRLGTKYSAGSAGRLFTDFGANCERTFAFPHRHHLAPNVFQCLTSPETAGSSQLSISKICIAQLFVIKLSEILIVSFSVLPTHLVFTHHRGRQDVGTR